MVNSFSFEMLTNIVKCGTITQVKLQKGIYCHYLARELKFALNLTSGLTSICH
jgi:hypothetical protein